MGKTLCLRPSNLCMHDENVVVADVPMRKTLSAWRRFAALRRMFLTRTAAGSDGDAAQRASNCLQALEMRTLPVLRGHLWKKKPATIKLKSYDKRFFVIGNHQLFWWATQEDSARPESARPRGGPLCKGVIDFIAEEVEIDILGESMFVLKPKRGAWSRRFEHAAGDPK